MTPIDQDTLTMAGFQHNPHYSSVEVIDRTKEIRDRMPDHLTLPKFSDKFVTKNDAHFVNQMAKKTSSGRCNLNDLKFFTSLRPLQRKGDL